MKIIFLSSLFISLGTSSFAQQIQTTPSTPITSTTVSTSSSTNSNYVVSVSNGDRDDKGNLSIAISETDDSYKLRASFSSKYDAVIKDLLLNKFGSENPEGEGAEFEWTLEGSEEEVYNVKFSSGKIRMELDKEQAAGTLIEKFVITGQEIKEFLSERK